MEETYEGLVIRTIHFNEASEIVHIFTEKGILSVLVKGARRYNSHRLSFCIPLTKVSFKVTSSKIPTLIDYSIIDSYSNIKDDLKKNLWFSYLLEILNKLPNDTYYSNIYKMIDKLLSNASKIEAIKLVMIAQIKLLKAYGVEPEFKKCVLCSNPSYDFFSISSGGFICSKHNPLDKENKDVYENIKRLYYFNLNTFLIDTLDDINFIDVFNAVNKYYSYYVDIKLHSLSSLII